MDAGNGVIGQSPFDTEMTDRLLLCVRITPREQQCQEQVYYTNRDIDAWIGIDHYFLL